MQRLLFLSLMALLLSGCLKRADTLAPIVSIYDPPNGTIRTATGLTISGFAMDDEGIAAVRVNNTDLLEFEAFASEKGKKLVEFGFQVPSLNEGEFTALIEVEDLSGRIGILNYQLQIDTTRPSLEDFEAIALGGGVYRIRGTARDNTNVASIEIGDVSLSFIPVPEKIFQYDVELEDGMRLVIQDGAGNSLSRPLP